MLLKIVLVCCLLALVSAKQLAASIGFLNGRIVGGEDAQVAEFPHQVSLQIRVPGLGLRHIYGGSVLSEYWILTAAHCVVSDDYEYHVKAGFLQLEGSEKTEQVSKVVKIILHEKYSKKLGVVAQHDIALVKLDKPLVFNEYVVPIQLPKQDEAVDGEVTLSGWGSIRSNGGLLANTLQKVELPIISNLDCKNIFEKLTGKETPVTPTNLCTGPLTGGIASCSGDSGGPLVKYENRSVKQVGILSWGLMPCAKYTSASVYTRVASYVNWIESNIVEN